MKMRLLITTAFAFCWIFVIVATHVPSASAADVDSQTLAQSIYLGRVEVHGQKNIIEALQAIKIGLQLPYSSDPKMANVVVCRLVPEAGSHITDYLICGTNRNLAKRRDALHRVMSTAIAQYSDPLGCFSNACYGQVFDAINQVLSGQPSYILNQRVSGAALRGMLDKIPYPTWWTTSATTAPAASTRH